MRFGTEHPRKDLEQNTIATFNVLEAMRANGCQRIAFSSTGSVYGEAKVIPTPEDAPFPVQTSLYGASKLAGEGLISAYCEGFGFQALVFRFVSNSGRAVHPRPRLRLLQKSSPDPSTLHILGNGKQRKSYLYIQDCIDAMLTAIDKTTTKFEVYNLGTDEYCEVNNSIGWICGHLGLSPALTYGGGERGWIGDNPFIFLETKKFAASVETETYDPRRDHQNGQLSREEPMGAGSQRLNEGACRGRPSASLSAPGKNRRSLRYWIATSRANFLRALQGCRRVHAVDPCSDLMTSIFRFKIVKTLREFRKRASYTLVLWVVLSHVADHEYRITDMPMLGRRDNGVGSEKTSLAGKVAVVTGASRGFGRVLCDVLWQAGADLFVTARDGTALADLASELNGRQSTARQRIETFASDIGGDGAAAKIVDNAKAAFGGFDIVVCNAAMQGPIGLSWEVEASAWKDALVVDLIAPVELANRVVPVLLSRGGGSIVFISGGGATGPRPRFSAYATAKAGLVRFAETLAHELKGTNVTVNAVAPGAMPTGMLEEIVAAGGVVASEREYEIATRVLSDGYDVMVLAAKLVAFLASDVGHCISGRLVSAQSDRWEDWPAHAAALDSSDLYTLRRITGRDRGQDWGINDAGGGHRRVWPHWAERAKALGPARLLACADVVKSRAEALAKNAPDAVAYDDWRAAVAHPGVDIVIIATLHNSLAEITEGAICAGHHVLVEKPAARRAPEIAHLPELAAAKGVQGPRWLQPSLSPRPS